MLEAAEGIKPEQSWVHVPISVLDLRFELTPFLFINIVGYPHIDIVSICVFNNIVG